MLEHTKEELATIQCERLTELILFAGNMNHLAKMLDVSVSTVAGWVARRRISKKGALKVQGHPRFISEFTADYLRPDI